MSEKKLQDKIIRHVKKRQSDGVQIHWLKIHGNGVQRSGEPDLIICAQGKFFAVELKHGNNKATKLQLHRLEKWREAGATAAVVRSLEEFKLLLSE